MATGCSRQVSEEGEATRLRDLRKESKVSAQGHILHRTWGFPNRRTVTAKTQEHPPKALLTYGLSNCPTSRQGVQ